MALTRKEIVDYISDGTTVFSLKSKKTNKQYTFRVWASEPKFKLYINRTAYETKEIKTQTLWVSLLTAPDEYTYLGTGFLTDMVIHYRETPKSPPNHPVNKYLSWFFNILNTYYIESDFPPNLEFLLSGNSGRCGRELIHPDSIPTGLGPNCAGRG